MSRQHLFPESKQHHDANCWCSKKMSAQPNRDELFKALDRISKYNRLGGHGNGELSTESLPDDMCRVCGIIPSLLKENIESVLVADRTHTLQAKQYTRLEVIDHTDQGTGREYSKWVATPFTVKFDEQDDGRTLKIFVEDGVPSNNAVHIKKLLTEEN